MTAQDSEQETPISFWPQTAFNWLELIFKMILVLASIGAVYQYFDIKQENRVKQTMEQLKRFNSGKLHTSRLKLSATWGAYQKSFEILNQQTVASEQDKLRIQAKIVLSIIHQNKLQKDVSELVDFFDNLQVCVKHRICDEEVSRDFFGDYIDYFYHLHKPWIEIQRIAIPRYACQLQAFAMPIYQEAICAIR